MKFLTRIWAKTVIYKDTATIDDVEQFIALLETEKADLLDKMQKMKKLPPKRRTAGLPPFEKILKKPTVEENIQAIKKDIQVIDKSLKDAKNQLENLKRKSA